MSDDVAVFERWVHGIQVLVAVGNEAIKEPSLHKIAIHSHEIPELVLGLEDTRGVMLGVSPQTLQKTLCSHRIFTILL